MYKIGLSTNGGKLICDELFENYSRSGISAMEVSVGAMYNYEKLDYKELLRLSKQYNVGLWALHLPFLPFEDIDISKPELADKSVTFLCNIISKASDIGINKFIIHASGEPIPDEDRATRMKRAKESLAILAEFAAKHGGVIAVEDLPRTCLGRNSDEISELISVDDRLRVCFDTNHLLSEDPIEFIHKLGDKIITMHVADYDFINERHWLPGEGKLDWNAILQALKDIGYNGIWLYEISFICPPSIIRNRDLTCEDFAKNASELFAGKTPTVFSKHIPNLGM